MKVFRVKKNYSWLQIPVKMDHYQSEAHITVKFFKDAPICPIFIERVCLIADEKIKSIEVREWKPVLFGPQGDTPVLEILGASASLWDLHKEFALVRNDFNPYRPHITVNKKFWKEIEKWNLSPRHVHLTLGELELYCGKNVVIK